MFILSSPTPIETMILLDIMKALHIPVRYSAGKYEDQSHNLMPSR
jgi:hypothetical protein